MVFGALSLTIRQRVPRGRMNRGCDAQHRDLRMQHAVAMYEARLRLPFRRVGVSCPSGNE